MPPGSRRERHASRDGGRLSAHLRKELSVCFVDAVLYEEPGDDGLDEDRRAGRNQEKHTTMIATITELDDFTRAYLRPSCSPKRTTPTTAAGNP